MNSGGHLSEPGIEISVVMPCLNEEDSVGLCVQSARKGIERSGMRGEVVVCDNGSADGSVEIAQRAGARVVHESRRGYGRAYLTGIEASAGRIIVIADSDSSYDLSELDRLVAPLSDGYDYVLGSRFAGTILPGAMPALNRYLGNPLLTAVLNVLFGLDTTDAHSGMRAFTRDAVERMQLRREGMEFASEIVVAAARSGLRVTEVPITYHPRIGDPKLRRWRDGLRHLRFMFGEALAGRQRAVEASPRESEPLDALPDEPSVAVVAGNGSSASPLEGAVAGSPSSSAP